VSGWLARAARQGRRLAGTARTALDTARLAGRLASGGRARDRAEVLSGAARRILRLHGIELMLSGPLPEGPALLACNHVSWLDPLVVAAAIPCLPISKAEVAGWPVLGRVARLLGVLFVSRGDVRSGASVAAAAERALGQGLPVLNFPEGTTSDGREVLSFRRGLFGIARRARVPVIPVALAYEPAELAWTGDQSFLPHYLRLAALPGARVALRFGPPIPCEAEPEGLAHRARAEVVQLLGGSRAAAVGS